MPLPTAPEPWSFYRLGPAKEKKLFKRRRETYDGVVVPAHIASYYSVSCSKFIGALGKPYFVDPMTYIFANDPRQLKRFIKDKNTGRTLRDGSGKKKKGDIKRSYSKLVEVEYGGVIQQVVKEGRPASPKDFKKPGVAQQFVGQVLAFQRNRLAAVPDKYKKYEKYAQKTGRTLATSPNLPMCLVPPYFPTTTLDARGWHTTNVEFIRHTKAAADGIPVFAVILADTAVIAKHIDQIASDYSAAGADGFLLWPDGFSGNQEASVLRIVFDAVQLLSTGDTPVILMYGDAFSLALRYAGLTGFSCGICYGERKLCTQDIDVEGAIPPRYYLRRLKKKMQIETEVRRIQIAQYPDLVCTCDICQRKRDPATLDDVESREHFMLVRADELAELRDGLTREQFCQMLTDALEQHRSHPLLQPLGHLQNWLNLLGAEHSA